MNPIIKKILIRIVAIIIIVILLGLIINGIMGILSRKDICIKNNHNPEQNPRNIEVRTIGIEPDYIECCYVEYDLNHRGVEVCEVFKK